MNHRAAQQKFTHCKSTIRQRNKFWKEKKVTSLFLIISKLLIYTHYVWGIHLASNSFCFPTFIFDLGKYFIFPKRLLNISHQSKNISFLRKKETSLSVYPCISSPKEWVLPRPTNSLWQNIQKQQFRVLRPVFPPSSQHTHFKWVTSNQHLQFLSAVIFVRAESRSNLNSITLTVICKSLNLLTACSRCPSKRGEEKEKQRRFLQRWRLASPEISQPYTCSVTLP